MEERISAIEGAIKGMDTSIKENVKCKKFLTQNIQEIWHTVQRPNLRIIGIEENKDHRSKGQKSSSTKS
jgi:DNA-binding FrmR family transcriptional regulator